MKKTIVILAAILIIPSAILANEQDVKGLVGQAVTFFQDKGQDYSVKVFNALHGPFVKGPFYVFVGTLDGRMLAHPFSKDLLEKPLMEVKDTKGKLFFHEFIDVAKSPGEGWVEYWWPYPGTKEPTLKRSYVKRVPDKDIWISAGYYTK
jgi:cytochrome c